MTMKGGAKDISERCEVFDASPVLNDLHPAQGWVRRVAGSSPHAGKKNNSRRIRLPAPKNTDFPVLGPVANSALVT